MVGETSRTERASDRKNMEAIRAEIFERTTGGRGMRFTQDSPILPDAFLQFAQFPNDSHDILINPVRGERAGYVARDMRLLSRRWRQQQTDAHEYDPARIAHVPGLIVATLHFNEMMRIVLPSTLWWERRMADLRLAFAAEGVTFAQSENIERRELFEAEEIEILKRWMGQEWPTSVSGDRVQDLETLGAEPPYDFLKLIRIAGLVRTASRNESDRRHVMRNGVLLRDDVPLPADEEDKTSYLLRRFMELYRSWPADPAHPPNAGIVFNVTLNRRAEPAVLDSTKAMKADAGRLLFNISCKSLRWAIIDSGIDAGHPAFAVRDDDGAVDQDAGSRVVNTYDLGELRLLLDPNFLKRLGKRFDPNRKKFQLDAYVPENTTDFIKGKLDKVQKRLEDTVRKRMTRLPLEQDAAQAHLSDEERMAQARIQAITRQIGLVVDRIEEGLEIDWATIEPLIEDVTPDRPAKPHGTQVAGILAADWSEVAGDAGKRKVISRGVCPDIRLIDLRVLAPTPSDQTQMAAHDFEVISALKFIGHLNSRADEPFVHGANVSISIAHDVARFACGRTPVCEESERLVASGVVVVAAAGNSGYANEQDVSDRFYRSASITDPGNAEAVITVGSTHRQRPHQYGVSYFSSRGPTGDGRRKPDLVAPGEKISTTAPGKRLSTVDGTSFAAPHVSGAAAMLMARHTELMGRPTRIKQILCGSATCLGREPYYQGAGMLDVLRALQSI